MAKLLGNGAGAGFEKSGTELTKEQADRQVDMDRICRAWVNHVYTDAEWGAFLRQQGTASLAELSKATSQKDRAEYEAALNDLAKAIAGIGKKDDTNPTNEEIASLVSELKKKTEIAAKVDPIDLHKELLKSFKELDEKFVDSRSSVERAVAETSVRLANLNEQVGVIKDGLGRLTVIIDANREKIQNKSEGLNTLVTHIEFDKGSHELVDSSIIELKSKLIRYKDKNYIFNVSGYTDSAGSVELNEKLAFRRGAVVRDWLIDELGVSSSKITVTGHVRPYAGTPQFAGKRLVVIRVLGNEEL
jgi:outer membrane protein OmpA-like peptidoglycan-associated protein